LRVLEAIASVKGWPGYRSKPKKADGPNFADRRDSFLIRYRAEVECMLLGFVSVIGVTLGTIEHPPVGGVRAG
jgi:hypothetical protein